MIRTAGDFTTQALLNACQVSKVDIFELALRYNKKSTKLLHLEENTSRIHVSDHPVKLNCID